VNPSHPAVTYLENLFKPDDLLCLTFIHGTKTYAHGGAVTTNVFVPLSTIITDGGIDRLIKRNETEHIYVSMAPFKVGSENRTKSNISEVRHVFMDADADGESVLARVRQSVADGDIPVPTVIVQSSPGKYQFVWNVEGFDIPLQEAMNRTLQKKFSTDAQAVDAARVLRVPGFRNIKAKYPDKPVAQIIELHPDEFLPVMPGSFNIPIEAADRTVHEPASSKEVQDSIDYLEAAMDAASVGFTRKPWDGSGGATKFMLAVCPWCDSHESGGDGDAIAIVMPSAKYAFKCLHDHCSDKKWDDFRAHLEEQAAPTVLKFGERPPPEDPKPSKKKKAVSRGR
jgi:DNA primase RepB-like protein